jgi:hypothetical protein
MTEHTVLFLGLGRLFIFLIQKAPYKDLFKWSFLKELFDCDLCLGWWVYLTLSFAMNEVWFREVYVPVVSQVMTCSVATFGMWLIRQGWDAQFREIVFKE